MVAATNAASIMLDSQGAPQQRLLTVDEIANFLSVKPDTVHRYIARRHNPLPSLRVGGVRRFELPAVIAWARRGSALSNG